MVQYPGQSSMHAVQHPGHRGSRGPGTGAAGLPPPRGRDAGAGPGPPLRRHRPASRDSVCPVFSQQQMKHVAENLKEDWREGGKEEAP